MIHQYKKNNNNIVLDVGSGSVHLVDDVSYNIIKIINENISILTQKNIDLLQKTLIDKHEHSNINTSFNEILALYKSGKLFSDDDYKKHIKNDNYSPIKAMCLHVAHDCNLRCKYCFASTGEYDGNRAMMDINIGKKSVDFLIENSGNRKNLEVDFFGGEPLMNFEMVKETVSYARSKEKKYNKNFRFTMTTNGVLLNKETREYLNDNMDNIVLSIDGRKEINDNMRLTINGQGSYNIIINNIKEMVKLREEKQYYVRGTFTKNNLDFSEDVIDLYNQGFKQISVEPVITNENEKYALLKSDINNIIMEYDILAKKLLNINKEENNLNFFHFNIDLTGGPCITKRIRGCGAGNDYVAITPDGDIFPCHQFVGKNKWKMGNLIDGTFDINMKKNFSKQNIYTKDNCENCWAKFYCSGGCLANSNEYNGDFSKTHEFSCRLEKARVETAIMLKVEEAKNKSHVLI